ncbi:adenylate kinase isoenzyme 1-like [Drosophila biarmipes]|uniref:adenylate kinase isoenzyme 1-like n=1 Tax=Drosophila biarmipes TaxID=125945 RepID=UPI0007E85AB4|nr:adenylate kinase isoenzyme 1-like [Drosophila biarmipes]XP_050741828.1 adenylate kinase isoenzyme 1-like [Drosophila biarmipes]
MNAPMIWVMGGPGSGKGTQSQKIERKYGYKHIDPIALMEQEISSKTAIGLKLEEFQLKGEPVPLQELVPLIEHQLMTHRGGLKGFVIDGYPADLEEAEILEDGFGSPAMIIALELAEEAGSQRSSLASGGVQARPSLSMYIDSSKAVMERYAHVTLKVDADQQPDSVFEEIQLNMDTFVKPHGRLHV